MRSTLIISILFLSLNSFASPQVPDYVIYKGDTIPVYKLILEQYFQKIEKSDKGSLFGLKFREGASFNCWRGYQAIYSIENDSLFLKNIIDCGEWPIDQTASEKRIKEIFNDKVNDGKVHIDWFSGEFSLPNGELLRWDGVFHKTFENEILIKVNNGKVKKISTIENYVEDAGRINRKYGDTISNMIFNKLQKHYKNADNPLDCSERFTFLIGKNGEIKKVSLTDYRSDEIDEYFDKKEYKYCIQKLKSYLEDVKFDIIKSKGKAIEEEVIVEIWLNDDGSLENWTD